MTKLLKHTNGDLILNGAITYPTREVLHGKVPASKHLKLQHSAENPPGVPQFLTISTEGEPNLDIEMTAEEYQTFLNSPVVPPTDNGLVDYTPQIFNYRRVRALNGGLYFTGSNGEDFISIRPIDFDSIGCVTINAVATYTVYKTNGDQYSVTERPADAVFTLINTARL